MEKLVGFFEHMGSLYRFLAIVAGILFFWAIEGLIPLVNFRYNKVRHAGPNLFFTLTTVIVNFFFAFLIVWTSKTTSQAKFGLLYIFHLPFWLFVMTGLLILDLVSAWFIHWLQHKIRWMWKFHLIHHTDTFVDTTTANRHHPTESLFRAIFTLIAVAITGAPIWLLFMYQFLSVLLSQFNHANISFPRWVDNSLSWVIVSPNMHKVHHHYLQPLTDKNYGNIFSCWDRLFGTYVKVTDPSTLKYGINSVMKEQENDQLGKLLKMPFEEYRPPAGSKFSEFNG
jgi:sterol desaturase/sphingolipid hydroxylase (fatty acid hydroxylase superfamily)